MTNAVRGEHTFHVEGVGDITLLLNMGALAKIESSLGCTTVGQMIQRLAGMGVSDIMIILHALAVAGGHKELRLEDIHTWPPTFSVYSVAIQETMIAGGFIKKPSEGPSPNEQSQ